MSVTGNGSEQSMEEILASIRSLISQEGAQQVPADAPAPAMPQPAPQRSGSEPAADAKRPDEVPQSALGRHNPAPVPNAFPASSAPSAIPPVAARQDDDDLADLLDDPLDPSDLRPAITDESAKTSAGSPAAVAPAAKPVPDTPATTATAPGMSFDFGSLVPNRDAGPLKESDAAISGQSRPHEPSFATGLTTSAGPTADTPSPGWPESPRRFPTGLSTGTAATSSQKQADVPASQESRKPDLQLKPGPSTNAALSGGNAGGSLTPSGTGPSHSPVVDGLTAAPRGNSQQVASASQSNGGRKPAETGSSQGSAPAASQGPEVTSPTAMSQPDAPGFPSIEPVLKAFERSVPAPSTASDVSSQNAVPRAKVEFGSRPLSSGFSQTGGVIPGSAKEPAPVVAKDAATTTTPAQQAATSRTLEEAVMDLLRPMLREWLDENLPGIIEAAIRREVADTIKSKVGSP